ncbi:MAG: NUDIX hydrolase [Methylobacteriaceae bacterium]|jgi:8-oxo-dGTP diphosphatase|nr:NUDIX hydrolase [Methylobacteriaceae bacterium]
MREFFVGVGLDVVLVNKTAEGCSILLIKRRNNPYAGCWALPGGFLEPEEDLEDGARRELMEETSLKPDSVPLTQVGAFGRPDRDSRGRVISIAYCGILPAEMAPLVKAEDDAAEAGWHPLDTLPPLAFDHADIIAKARRVLEV